AQRLDGWRRDLGPKIPSDVALCPPSSGTMALPPSMPYSAVRSARDFVTRTSATSPQPPVPLTYQPALDGLRAIAVLAVMLFHAGVPLLPGGFLGVDIFFVLSGYLITTLLAADFASGDAAVTNGAPGQRDTSGTRAANNRIHLGRFYMRRALRLFPALLLLVAFLQFWTMRNVFPLPGQVAEIRREIVTTLLYVANWAQVAHMVARHRGAVLHRVAARARLAAEIGFSRRGVLDRRGRSACVGSCARDAV